MTPTHDPYGDDEEEHIREPAPDADDVTSEMLDKYISTEFLLTQGDAMTTGTVRRRKWDRGGDLHSTAHYNPILDMQSYKVEFPDGQISDYATNTISENMWAQCNIEANQGLIMSGIVDHKTEGHSVEMYDAFITKNDERYMRRATKGRKLCVEWKYISMSWERMSDLK